MSDYEHKENTGTIFKNQYKKTDKHPEYKGEINVDGVLWDIALWVKDGAKGKYFSAQITPPYKKDSGPAKTDDELGGDVPF